MAALENMIKHYELSGGFTHDGEKGAFREFLIAEIIRPLMPLHFGVSSGIVVAADGRQSRQTDVIIYDRRLLPPILIAGDRGIFPIDSVLAVLEVKSVLKAGHYEGLVEASRRFCPPSKENPKGLTIVTPGTLRLEKDVPGTIWPLYAVFAYHSDAKQDELIRLRKRVRNHNDTIRLIGVLDKGVWSYENGEWRTHKSDSLTDNGIVFVKKFLNKLESTADSRGTFRLQDWLK